MRGCITLGRQYNFTWSQIWWIGSFLVVLALAGCGGQLGRIEPSAVDTAIATAAAAIRGAADSDAATLVPETFGSAQSNLEAAKEALSEKQGSEALRLAYQAAADARLAQRTAISITESSELNAVILEKEAGTEGLRKKLVSTEKSLAGAQSDLQVVRQEEYRLQQMLRQLQQENRELSDTRASFGRQVSELTKSLEEIQARCEGAEASIANYGKEISMLRDKLEAAGRMVREEGYQKRAAIAEAADLRRQLREQAEAYTAKLAKANQQSTNDKQGDYLKQKAREARDYVDSQPALSPPKTGRTALTTGQIAAGKTALSRWERAWENKDLNAHLAYYDPNVIADKVIIVESRERRGKIDRQQLEVDLRQMLAHSWTKAKTETEVEHRSVIGVQRLSRLVSPAADENATALYDVWIREVWMHPVGNAWKIHREIWKIFKDTPDF